MTLNGAQGIEAGMADPALGDAAVANDTGLLLGGRSAYRENVIRKNPSGCVTPAGSGPAVDLGESECDGIACP
ncbi:MAG: hypothetical protein R3F35_02255 [Myxococcota bacterium]